MASNFDDFVTEVESGYSSKAAAWNEIWKKIMIEDAQAGISTDLPEGDVFYVAPTDAS